eukprot:COSAG02_NODE_547_length_20492_cov_265.508802_6_plen_67_part_00
MAKLESFSIQLRSVTNEDGTHPSQSNLCPFCLVLFRSPQQLLQLPQSTCRKISSGSIWMLHLVSKH